jgi:hypothetical protein
MIIIAFERADHSALGNGATVNEKLKKPMSRNVDSVLAGLLWVVLMLLSILYMFRYRLIVADQIPTCCFIGLLLSQLSILNACKQEKSIFDRNVVVNGAYLTMLAVLIIFFVLVFLLPPFGGLFGVRGISIFAFCGAAFPTIAITLFFEVQKRINNHKE